MSSLVFLLVKSAKNSFFELLRKPAKLIMWIVFLAMIVGLIVLSLFTTREGDSFQDIIWLKGILFLLILLFVGIAVQKGLSNGDAIFDMNDVNLLFVSPVNPRLILMYGIVKMAKTSFLAGFFILFQSNSLKLGFGVGFDAVLIVLLGFMLANSLLQVISLLIYTLTNSRPRRKMAVKIIAVAIFLPLIAKLGIQLAGAGNPMTALENTMRSPVFSWTPVAGWTSEGVVALIAGDLAKGLLFLGITVLTGALLILYIALSNPDYYEDVLVATETTFEKKRSLSEGQINPEAASTKKIKVARTGISGLGSNTIFYKHLRESFRANRFGLWGLPSVITIVSVAILSSFLPSDAGGLLIILQILMWMQIFMIGTGRGLKELYTHYIYLIPESSFRKIIWSNLEIAFKVLVESVVLFSVSGLIMGETIVLILLTIAVYTLFSFLLLGINYLSMRWTGADISAGMMIMLYMFAVMIIMAPGLAAAIALGTTIEGIGVLIGMGVLAGWELLAGLLCFALSRGILHNSDMPVLRTGK